MNKHNHKRIALFHNKTCVFDKKVTRLQQQNKKANTKILAGTGNWTRNLSSRSLECYMYHSATESTEHIDWSQAI